VVVVLLVASTTTGAFSSVTVAEACSDSLRADSTNMDKYHPGYFGKVGMRHFHLTRNQYWRPVINIDKLWTLVPAAEKEGLCETSDVVPVIDTLQHGYGKVLGKGRLPKIPFIVKARFVSSKAECVSQLWFYTARSRYLCRAKIKEAGGVVSLIA